MQRFNKQLKPLVLFLFVFLSYRLTAQIYIVDENKKIPATIEMHMQVKQLSQFIERFNYVKIFQDRNLDSTFKSQFMRNDCIKMLFNASDVRLDTTSTKYSIKYDTLSQAFINYIIDENIKLSFLMKDITVEVESVFLYKGEKKNVKILLKKEVYPDNSSEWQIINVYADFLKIKQDSIKQVTIPPNSNETNFLKFSAVFKNKESLEQYYFNDYSIDNLSIFTFLINNGSLTFQHNKNLKYHILTIEGWIIRVEEFLRNTNNSGWLIDELIEANDEEKVRYVIETLHLSKERYAYLFGK